LPPAGVKADKMEIVVNRASLLAELTLAQGIRATKTVARAAARMPHSCDETHEWGIRGMSGLYV
jgi:hypothetical protein